jgi:PAS domain S-box-containing protein
MGETGGAQNARLRERWRAVFENAPDVITELDLDGRILITNSVPNHELDRVVGRVIFDIIPPKMHASVRLCLDEVTRSQEPTAIETHFDGPDRESWWVTRFVPVKEGARVVSILAIATEFTAHKLAEEERERLIAELQEALEKVKTLSGLLPICAGCKNIRDDRGYWQRIEGYISERSEAEFTHGLCPACLEKLYADLRDDDPAGGGDGGGI